jgi:hypothetical protein
MTEAKINFVKTTAKVLAFICILGWLAVLQTNYDGVRQKVGPT